MVEVNNFDRKSKEALEVFLCSSFKREKQSRAIEEGEDEEGEEGEGEETEVQIGNTGFPNTWKRVL